MTIISHPGPARSVALGAFIALAAVCGITGAAARAAEIRLAPTTATGPGDFTILDNQIFLEGLMATVELEIQVRGWSPELLRMYQAEIDSSGYTSGEGVVWPVTFPDPSAGAFIDESHPNFVHEGFSPITAVDTSSSDYRFGSTSIVSGTGPVDTGAWRYAGTLILDVTAATGGTFSIGFMGNGRQILSTYFGDAGTPWSYILPLSMIPALITFVGPEDCNENLVPDDIEIAQGTERDCNGNLILDSCDLAVGNSADCNGNGVPDECDVFAGTVDDCNTNGQPDDCDIVFGTSLDVDPADGIPDECKGFADQCTSPDEETFWSCCENWPVPPEDCYPDDSDPARAGDVHPQFGYGESSFLDVTAQVPSVTFDQGSQLLATQTGTEGNLLFSVPAALKVAGTIYIGDGRTIGETNTPTGAIGPEITVHAQGKIKKAPPTTGTSYVNATIYARKVYIFGGSEFTSGGSIELRDSMTLNVAQDLVMQPSPEPPTPGRVASLMGGISPPPKLKIEDSSSVLVQGTMVLAGPVESTNTSSAGVTLMGNFDNQATMPSLYDWTTGTLIMNGSSPQTFEVAGLDFGQTMEGFSTDADTRLETEHHNNFAVGTIELAALSDVTFQNKFANTVGSGACNEALYVGNLIFAPDSAITIDNCKVYYVNLEANGVTPTTTGTCAELLPVSGVAPVIRDPYEIVKNRYISIVLPPMMTAGSPAGTAIRVTLSSLHHPDAPADAPDFGAWESGYRWVNALAEGHTCPDSPNFYTTIRCAVLGCFPEYRPWAAELGGDVLYITGAAVVPSSEYQVTQFDSSCEGNEQNCTAISAELSLVTSQYGDVDPDNDALVVLDVARIVDHMKGKPYPTTWPPEAGTALYKPSVHLRPNVPDVVNDNVSVLDVATGVDAVKGNAYWHFGDFGPCTDECPNEAACP